MTINRIMYYTNRFVKDSNPTLQIAKQWFTYHKLMNVLGEPTEQVITNVIRFNNAMLFLKKQGVRHELAKVYDNCEINVDAEVDVSVSQSVSFTLDGISVENFHSMDVEGDSNIEIDAYDYMDNIRDEMENYGYDIEIDSSYFRPTWDDFEFAERPSDCILVNYLYERNEDYEADDVQDWVETKINTIQENNTHMSDADFLKFYVEDLRIASIRMLENEQNSKAQSSDSGVEEDK